MTLLKSDFARKMSLVKKARTEFTKTFAENLVADFENLT
jgi:hypothetical protein